MEYVVGGAIRDGILGRKTMDIDYVVTGSNTEAMQERFGESIGRGFPDWLDDKGNEWA